MGDKDAVGTAETQAVGAGEQKWVFEELQADWAGQLWLQSVHSAQRRPGGTRRSVSKIQKSRSAVCAPESQR